LFLIKATPEVNTTETSPLSNIYLFILSHKACILLILGSYVSYQLKFFIKKHMFKESVFTFESWSLISY